MTPTLVLIFFLATTPIIFMPSIFALFTRHKSRMLIVCANLLLWVVIFIGARAFTIESSSKFQLPTLLALAAWLVLLGYSIRGNNSKA